VQNHPSKAIKLGRTQQCHWVL